MSPTRTESATESASRLSQERRWRPYVVIVDGAASSGRFRLDVIEVAR